MTEQQKNIVRMVGLLDILIAIGLAAGVVLGGLDIPILVPILMAVSGVALFVVSYAIK